MVFAYISVKGWIVDPYVQSFFDSSHEVLVLSPHNTEILNSDIVTSDVVMVKYWGRGLQMFLESLSKSSWGLTNIFLITLHPVTFISIYDSTPLLDRILIFGSHQEVFDGGSSFKVHLHPMTTAHLLEAFTEPSVIWNNYVWFLDVVSSSVFFRPEEAML